MTFKMWHVTCDTWHVTCDMCSRVFDFLLVYIKIFQFYWIQSKSPNHKLCNSPMIQIILLVFYCLDFIVHFWIFFFFKSEEKKNWQLKNQNDHPNCGTILLLVMRRFLNYTKKGAGGGGWFPLQPPASSLKPSVSSL